MMLFSYSETREWLQPAVEGPIPTARGCHSSVVAGGQLVIFGGTSDFNTETMQCDRFYNDIYTVPTGRTMFDIFFTNNILKKYVFYQ